ncbi:MAG: hypothetical protein ACSHYF_11605 [Verrucomicrobiaceae bacterium]
MSEVRERRGTVPVWKIWANPIVRRYARSRLRPVSLGVFALIFVLIAAFIFFVVRQTAIYQGGLSVVDAARIPIMPLLVLQGIILFMLGTGQVAGAMTAEADEGVLDYQRLAPMTPLSKVVGYLFGLPIREWVIFACTLPFSIWSMWEGEVPLKVGVQLYAVFVAAGVLYHMTGLLAGTVMKNRRWAFLSAMGLIFVLYTVLPQVSKFGLVYFKYLTILPVVEESSPFLIERKLGAALETYQRFVPMARFFGLNFPQVVFTLLSQGVLVLVMGTMLWRRWRRAESHLLGKIGAVGFFGWIQLVLLGNALPLIETGELFPSREMSRRWGRFAGDNFKNWSPEPGEVLVMLGMFGVVTIVMLWLMIALITPDFEGQVRGWRRARKRGRETLSVISDPATSTPWVLAMVGIGFVGWVSFAKELINSRWFPEYELSVAAPVVILITLFSAGILFQTVWESKGKKFTGMMVILVGVVPVMLGTILAVTDESLHAGAVWLIGICPLAWPVYGAQIIVPIEEVPLGIARAIPMAFYFWQGVSVLGCLWMLKFLWKTRKVTAEKTVGGNE